MFNKAEVAERKAQLVKAGKNLKKHFTGIDYVIDNIISKIEIWWCYPDFLTRPTVINLYSLTGSGKTDLVRRLSEELGLQDKFCNIELDNGKTDNQYEWGGDSSILSKLHISKIRTSDQSILLLDEIQRYRTISNGVYINSKFYNDIWKLLSDGRLTNNQDRIKWFKETINRINSQMTNDMISSSMVNKNNDLSGEDMITEYKKSAIQNDNVPSNPNDKGNMVNTDRLLGYIEFTEEDEKFIWDMKVMLQSPTKWMMDKFSIEQTKFMKESRLLDSISNAMLVNFMERKFDEIINASSTDTDDDEYVYSKLLIFVSGNLDNVFIKKTDDNKPLDIVNAFDILRKHTETISVDDIKKELLNMFRPEQVSRFGNNYIIYKSLVEEDFHQIVVRDIENTIRKINKKYDVEITNDIINIDDIWNKVKEVGIYPDQGVRPVFSTVASVMGDIIPNVLIKLIND